MLASSREPRPGANARGRDKSLPYESEQTVRPTGKCKPCMIANPCRGRFYIGPGTPRRRKPGGYESAPTQVSRVGNARRSRLMRYIRNDRRAGCPHPAAPCAAANTRGRDKSLPYEPGQTARSNGKMRTPRHENPKPSHLITHLPHP